MNFDDLKDRISEQLSEIWGKIQDSPTYNTLRERYDTLSPAGQRGLIFGGLGLATLLLFSLPYSYLSSSSDYNAKFENNRQLLRGLLRASRLASEASSVPTAASADEIKGRIQNEIATFNLLPEQVGGVIDLETSSLGSPLAASSLPTAGVGLSLKKLNLKQIVDIGYKLQDLSPTVKLAGVETTAGKPDPRYFDVLFKLVVFKMPEVAAGTAGETDKSEESEENP